MEEVIKAINENHLVKRGETIGVAVSGGIDSMSLLHFMNEQKEKLDIDVVAITVDHCLRENSFGDSIFVQDWCKKHGIYCHRFSVDANKIANEKNIGIEQAAREARYGVFDALLKKGIVDKIALAHHVSDQAETILLHILRGAGLTGASGMEYIRKGVYIRPFLNVQKDDIVKYALINDIDNIEDETNGDSSFNRNFIRNEIIPMFKKRWPTVEQNLVNFGKACKEDDEYIINQASFNALIVENNLVKIPYVYFLYKASLTNRIIIKALESIEAQYNIERVHINMIKDLAKGENGRKISLPNGVVGIKEYEYITLIKKEKRIIADEIPFAIGKTNFANIQEITVRRTKDFTITPGKLLMDAAKLPKDAVWRVMKKGDTFTKFGGGTKSLRNYLIDKKIASRVRQELPVLAKGSEVYCILGVEISDSVKIDDNTKMAYIVSQKEINL